MIGTYKYTKMTIVNNLKSDFIGNWDQNLVHPVLGINVRNIFEFLHSDRAL